MATSDSLRLFVFIDAFGWELLQRLPFLDDELRVKAPLDTIFGYSSTCDPTILTGKLPREHGHFSFFYYNPQDSPFAACRALSVLPKTITRRGRVRRVMSRALARWYGYTGYFQIYNMPFRYLHLFDYSEKRDIYQHRGINSGDRTIFDHLRDERIPFHLSDWRKSEVENLAALESALQEGEISFAYLYMAAMDATLHAEGTDSPNVAQKIAWYERRLRRVLEIARSRYRDVRLYAFSDHGMTDIRDQCDLMSRIDRLGLRFGEDYAAVYDSTMARFWFFDDGSRFRIIEALQQEPKGQILSRQRLHELGCDFPDHRYGQLFYLMNPGVLLCPSFMGETMLAGMHGYAPEDPGSTAMFAATAEPPLMPKRLDDLYRLMLAEAGEGGAADPATAREAAS